MYGYPCEYCDGIVREKIVKRESFKHKEGFVILENVQIGVCDHCGTRYYHASLLRRVAEVATGRVAVQSELVPVAQFA
ncbi:MAG: YgiT-type zinc finger protein [Chloroflexi bacterium]|nr:YgiT-type zinc finger protein [Chloroflexota bacterium]